MCDAHFSPHYGFLSTKHTLAALVHERTEALTLRGGVIKCSNMIHNMTETGGLGPDLTHKCILLGLHGA